MQGCDNAAKSSLSVACFSEEALANIEIVCFRLHGLLHLDRASYLWWHRRFLSFAGFCLNLVFATVYTFCGWFCSCNDAIFVVSTVFVALVKRTDVFSFYCT